MSPVFVNTVRASFYRFRPDLGGLRVGREIVSWRTKLRQCVAKMRRGGVWGGGLKSVLPGSLLGRRSTAFGGSEYSVVDPAALGRRG